MHDIRIPDSGPAGSGKKPEFEVSQVHSGAHGGVQGTMHGSPYGSASLQAEPGEKVKVKFEKFVQLVATHDFEGVMKRHAEEDIIVSTNLLTDLANAHEEQPSENKKMPIIFIVGIIIGVALTYFIVRF